MSKVTFSPGFYPQDLIGRPIANGKIYVGDAGTDPATNPGDRKTIQVLQEDGTTPTVAQPIRTSAGGVPTYSGSPVTILVSGSYALQVLDSNDAQVFYIPDVPLDGDGEFLPLAGGTMTGPVTFNNGTTTTPKMAFEALGGSKATAYVTGNNLVILKNNAGGGDVASFTIDMNTGQVQIIDVGGTGILEDVFTKAGGTLTGNLTIKHPATPSLELISTGGNSPFIDFAQNDVDFEMRIKQLTTTNLDIEGSLGTGTLSVEGDTVLTEADGEPVRARVNFDSTGTVTITSSLNVTSITDNGAGDFDVNFTSNVPADYAILFGGSRIGTGTNGALTGGMEHYLSTHAIGVCRVAFVGVNDTTFGLADYDNNYVAIVGG